MSEEKEKLQTVAAKLGIGEYHRHVFLCTGPKCCTPEEGMAAWEKLKHEVKIVHYHWPDFNVADSCIVIGACLLLIEIFRAQPERQ